MLEGHGYWGLNDAKRIAAAVEEFSPAWLEDLVLPHDIETVLQLKASTRTPVIASEMLTTRTQYRTLLERRAADLVMIDPTWAGGITESRKLITLAEAFGVPVALHDCTGPFTLLAGIHLAVSSAQVTYQETVRAVSAHLVPRPHHGVDLGDRWEHRAARAARHRGGPSARGVRTRRRDDEDDPAELIERSWWSGLATGTLPGRRSRRGTTPIRRSTSRRRR